MSKSSLEGFTFSPLRVDCSNVRLTPLQLTIKLLSIKTLQGIITLFVGS